MANTYFQQPMEQNERRHSTVKTSHTPKRRIDDSLLNKVRWPIFVYSWFVLGGVLLAMILYRVFAN